MKPEGLYPVRDSIEFAFCECCGLPVAAIIRLGEDGVTFEAAATIFIKKHHTAVYKGGVALGRGTKRLTRDHMRRADLVLKPFELSVKWIHNLKTK